MKRLILFLLLPALSFGQTDVKKISGERYSGIGKPGFQKYIANAALYLDNRSDSTWQFQKQSDVKGRWVPCTDSVAIRDLKGAKGDKGDTGPMGPQGPAGGGSSSQSIYHIIANGTDQTWEVQRAVDSSRVTGRKILIDGKVKFSKGIKVAKDHIYLNIEASGEIQAINANKWTFFYSDPPADVKEAEGLYAFRKMDFENLVLKGINNKQSGFDLHSTEGARYEHVWCYDLDTAFAFTFSLRTVDDQCEANNCNVAYLKQSGSGLYAGATTSNSCSNGGTTRDFRVYGKRDGYGMITKDVSGQKYDGITLEGDTTITMFEYNNTSSTSTALDGTRFHVEGMSRLASIKIRSSTSTHVLDRPNFIKHNQVFILTEASSGYPNVSITNSSNQRVFFNGTTPIFQSGSGTGWKFINCDIPLIPSNVNTLFKGTIPGIGCGIGSGANRLCIENPINR